jgi:hypothetical protein
MADAQIRTFRQTRTLQIPESMDTGVALLTADNVIIYIHIERMVRLSKSRNTCVFIVPSLFIVLESEQAIDLPISTLHRTLKVTLNYL